MKRLIFLLPALAFLGIAGLFLVGLYMTDRSLDSALIGESVPPFDLPPVVEDRPGLASSDLQGEPVLVNFFASWCVPCRAEHPFLTELVESGAAKVHGISWKDDRAASRKWLEDLGNPYSRLGLDRDNDVGIDFGLYGVPETYVIDATGRIRYRHAGPVTPDIIESKILPALRAGDKAE